MLKKIIAIFTAFAVTLPVSVSAKAIYENKTNTNIASGIIHTNVVRLDGAGWQNINIIEADLTSPYVKTKVLTATNLNTLETVEKLANDNDTAAAVNADFFAWKSGESGKGSAVGTIMNDGTLLSSSSETDGMFTFAIDKFGKIICEHIKTNITLTAQNGNVMTIKHLNKYDSLAEPVIYTSAFSEITEGSYDNVLEVVIEDDTVVEMRRDMEGVAVPENGYVIRHLPEFDPFLTENLSVGDKVEIKIDANINLTDYETMTGGGTMLVTEGQLAKITHNVSGQNPRTVIACDKTRTKLYLITVDGRLSNAKGYTLPQLAEYLMEIGMYDAMNLDGGGSTTMALKKDGTQKVVNTPSEGSLRKVATGVGVISDAPKGEILSGFEILIKDYNVFSGTSRTFEIINPIDEYGNPFSGELPEIKWEIESGYGAFSGNVLQAENFGENITVSATYGTFTATAKINILKEIDSLLASASHFSKKQYNNPQISVIGKTKEGIQVLIEDRDVHFKEISPFVKNVEVLDKNKAITFSDVLDDFDTNVYTSSSYPDKATASITKEVKNIKSGSGSIKLSYDFLNVPNDQNGAAYLEFKKPITVSVVDKLGVWVYSPTVLNQWLRAEFKTADGEVLRETLSEKTNFSGWKYIEFNVPQGAEYLTKFYVVQNSDKEKSKGYVIFDALSVFEQSFNSELNVTPTSEITKGDINFSVIAGMPESKTLLTNLLAAKATSTLKGKDYVFSLSGCDFKNIDENKVTGYSSFNKNNSLFVTLNNSGGYTSAAQWQKFSNDTNSNFKNLFLFLNESPDLISNPEEYEMFKEMLQNISKKANVFVFYPDMHTYSYKLSGATFVSVGSLNATSPKTATMLIGKKHIPVVSVSGNKVTMSFINMY